MTRFLWADWKPYFQPIDEREDPALHDELKRLSVVGIKVSSWFGVGGGLFMLSATAILTRLGYLTRVWFWTDLTIVCLCLLAFPVWLIPRLHPYARLAGAVLGYGIVVVFIVTAAADPSIPGAAEAVPYNIVLVIMLLVAAFPFTPLHTLGVGFAMVATYLVVMSVFPDALFVPDVTPLFLASMALVILICIGLTAVIYRQRALAFQARQQVIRAQAQLALAESTAAQGRLAAALSHDLNSPIGVIASTLGTFGAALDQTRGGVQPSEQLLQVLGDLGTTARAACQRLKEIVERMQRYTNLDRAEEAKLDLNELIQDTIETLRHDLEDIELALDLHPIPTFQSRPQQLSAVFSNLLLNSRDATDGKGTVRVRSRLRGGEIIVEVEDDGRGIPAEKVTRIFEPSFKAEGGRVSVSNWGLFNCRGIIHGLGGEITIQSTEGAGTVVRIRLPAPAARA